MQPFLKFKRNILFFLAIFTICLSLSACAARDLTYETTAETIVDPAGNTVTIPEEVNSIAILGPSLVETTVDLGLGDKIEVIDTQSEGLEGIKEDVTALDIMSPNLEELMTLKPDVLLVTNLTYADQPDAFQPLIDAGTTVVSVPTAESIEDIQNDIKFLATFFNEEEKGQEIINNMQSEIDRIATIGQGIKDKKSVYFEISPAPDMYSFGSGVYLDEMLEIIGAENILKDESGWLPVTEEAIVSSNPDVILTNFDSVDDPVGEIKSRPGWNKIKAIEGGEVFYIDNMSSSLPNENIIKALNEMAKAIYPEQFNE